MPNKNATTNGIDTDGALIEVKINIIDSKVTKTLKLNTEVPIFQLCEDIRKNVREAQKSSSSHKTYGLFLPHDDWRKGLWLDSSKTLQHYIIRKGDVIEYRNRHRILHIRTLDGVSKTLKVDDSWTVAELMLTVCSKLGIYNYDEYSLISELPELLSPVSDKSSTMKRSSTLTRDQEKLDKLKRKNHTEDGLNWLNPSQSLRQQGIQEKEILLVKRKYFYSDMNVDKRDPIQLSLLYVQLRDAVITGTHPVTLDEALSLAGIQCQIQFGDYSSTKFKSGFLEITEFLPKEYLKISRAEKKIFIQHSKHVGLPEIEAREKYCLLCRSLKTYGITFFLVKEKVVGKNKLIPRLLGVNKDSVVQVDEKTKDIINRWPLTSIKHWAASFNGFTLDFGEYAQDNGYYTAQTDKGEKISQLINGYIDIILKRKKAKDHLGMDADEESVIYEENIAPLKAVIVEHVPKHPRPVSEEDVVMRKIQKRNNAPSGGGSVRISSRASDSIASQDYNHEDVMSQDEGDSSLYCRQISTQSPDSSITTGSHFYQSMDLYKNKQYVNSLNDNLKAIESYKDQIATNEQPVIVVQDEETERWLRVNLDQSRQRMTDEIGAMNAAVAQLLRSAQGLETIQEENEEVLEMQTNTGTVTSFYDQTPTNDEAIARLQNSFSVIAVHLPSLIEEIKTTQNYQSQLVNLEPEQQEEAEDLINAARKLADAFTCLIKAAYPVEEGTRQLDKQALVEAANNVGEVSNELLTRITEQETIHETLEVQRPPSIVLLTQQEQLYREDLLRLAKAVANATTNLIKEVKVVAVEYNSGENNNPDNEKKQKDIVHAATQTGSAISQLIATTKIVAPTIEQPVCQEQLIFAVEDVSQAVQQVVQAVHQSEPLESDHEQDENLQIRIQNTDQAANHVDEALEELMRHLRRNHEGDKQKTMDEFMAAYEKVLDREPTSDPEENYELVDAARKLAQATAGMIGEIKTKIEVEDQENLHRGSMDAINVEERDRMVVAVKQLTHATSELVDSAKKCSTEPDQFDLRYTLRDAADRFILVTYSRECAPLLQHQIINNLLTAARTCATTSTHLINTSQAAAKKSRASNYKVCNDGQELSQEISKLLIAIKEARTDPADQLYQLELIEACRHFLEPSEQLCQSCRFMWPTITDSSLQSNLNNSIDQSLSANEALRKYLHQSLLICRYIDLSAALKQLERLLVNLETTRSLIDQSRLIPLPDEKAEESTAMLIRSVKQAGNSGNKLKGQLEEINQSELQDNNDVKTKRPCLSDVEETGKISRELSGNLGRLVRAARGIAASIELEEKEIEQDDEDAKRWRKDAQLKVTDNCKEAIEAAHLLISTANEIVGSDKFVRSQDPMEEREKINEIVKMLSDSLNRCFDSLPGQRDLDMLSRHVELRKKQFVDDDLPVDLANKCGATVVTMDTNDGADRNKIKDVTDCAVEFNQAVNELAAAQSFTAIQKSCHKYKTAYDSILVSTNHNLDSNASANQRQSTSADQVRSNVINLSDCSLNLFGCAKNSIITEQDDIDQRKRLHDAARAVIESLNYLLNSTSVTTEPGKKECDRAIMKLMSMRPILDNPIHPISHKSYFECYDYIVEKTMPPLAESLRTIPLSTTDKDYKAFVEAIYQLTDNICWMVEDTAQTAYLIGIGDGSSKIGKKGLADHGLFLETRRSIQSECRKLNKLANASDADEDKIAQCAVKITENAKSLCEASRPIMSSYPRDKLKITQKIKSSLVSVNNLMTSVQQINSGKQSDEKNRRDIDSIGDKCRDIEANVDDLVDCLLNYQFASSPNNETCISETAKEAQEPLKAAGITVLDMAIEIVRCSADLANDPSESQYREYSSNCKDMNDALKHLTTTIRESAPGQKECQELLKLLEKLLRQVQETKIKLMKIRAKSKTWDSETEESYQKILESALRQMPHALLAVSKSGKREPEQLAHQLYPRLSQLIESISNGCLEASKHTELLQNSTIYLEHLSTILEANVQYVKAVKTCGGNNKATSLHSQIDEMCDGVNESCEDLLAALDKISISMRDNHSDSLEPIVETITVCKKQALQSALMPDNAKFGSTQSQMLEICYAMDSLNDDISQTAAVTKQPITQLIPLTKKLTQNYQDLCSACQVATSTIKIYDEDKTKRLQDSIQDVGQGSISLVKCCSPDGKSKTSSDNAAMLQNLQGKSKELHNRIDEVIKILIDANTQTQRCSEALKILQKIKKDVDSARIFLKTDVERTPTSPPKQNGFSTNNNQLIAKTKQSMTTHSNSIVNSIKSLVLSTSNPTQQKDVKLLADKSMDIALTLKVMSSDLLDCTDRFQKWTNQDKLTLLDGFYDIDIQLIRTAQFLRDLCEPNSDKFSNSSHQDLQMAGKESVVAITNFLKLFKEMEDKLPKDYEIIDETIVKLVEYYDEISVLTTEQTPPATKLPLSDGGSTTSLKSTNTNRSTDLSFATSRFAAEELGRLLPVLSNSTGRVIDILMSVSRMNPGDDTGAILGPNQEDIVTISRHSLKVNSELKNACQNLLKHTPANENQLNTVNIAGKVTDKYVEMLQNLKKHIQSPNKSTQSDMISSAKQCADLIKLLYQHVESLREGPKLVMYFRPSSPEWRDVSEKYIGRHVAYHHCYLKSYKNSSKTHTSVLHHNSPLLIPLNKENPSVDDLDKAKKQVRYVTTKLVHVHPNKNDEIIEEEEVSQVRQQPCKVDKTSQSIPEVNVDTHPTECHIDEHDDSNVEEKSRVNEEENLIGKDKYSVAEIDQLLTYIRDIGKSTECLINSSQQAPVESDEGNLFKSAIGIAEAMKELCGATSSALVSGNLKQTEDTDDMATLNPITKATKEISRSTQQLLKMLPEEDQYGKVQECGNDIQKKANLLLTHMAGIGPGVSLSMSHHNNNGTGVGDDNYTSKEAENQ